MSKRYSSGRSFQQSVSHPRAAERVVEGNSSAEHGALRLDQGELCILQRSERLQHGGQVHAALDVAVTGRIIGASGGLDLALPGSELSGSLFLEEEGIINFLDS